ncbi:MAG TPA: hypothetical protein VIL09_13330 [Microvirga sp.]
MVPHTLVTLLLGLSADSAPDLVNRGAAAATTVVESVRLPELEPRYDGAAREVTNWRRETVMSLDPGPVALVAALVKAERPVVTRCVKLNNYWCIKSARWNGEIGTDDEGHVGFASAARGADAAASLLRRYYLEFDRKSASGIVRRWAPAECGGAVAGGGATSIGGLAVRGIGGTVRARFLASNRVRVTAQAPARRGATAPTPRVSAVIPRASAPRVSAVIPRAGPAFRVPDIAAGLGERPQASASAALPYRATPQRPAARPAAPKAAPKAAPTTTGSLAAAPAPAPAPSPAPVVSCAPDEQRLRNYAGRLAEPLGLGPDDDLKLFEADGTPLPNLASVLASMSAFELGTLRADPDLIAGAVERQALRARALAPPAP